MQNRYRCKPQRDSEEVDMQSEQKHSCRFATRFVNGTSCLIAGLICAASFNLNFAGNVFATEHRGRNVTNAVPIASDADQPLIAATRIVPPLMSVKSINTKRATTQIALTHIQLKNARTVVAIADGRLLQSTDKGDWQDIGPIGARSIAATQFLNTDTGFAIERDDDTPRIWRTDDGGNNWQVNALPLAGEYATVKLHFADAINGFVIAKIPSSANFSFARLYATHDAGQTWRELAQPPAMGEIKFATPMHGWLLGGAAGRALYQTNNGGESWQRVVPTAALESDASITTELAMPIFSNGVFVLPALTTTQLKHGTSQMLSQFAIDEDASLALLSHATVFAGAKAARLINADQSIFLAGDVYSLRATLLNAASLPVLVDPTATAAFVSERHGARWVVTNDGICNDKKDCTTIQQVLSVDAFGDSFAIRSPVAARDTLLDKRVVQSTRRGFDACTAQSVSTLQAWFTNSPYKDVNFYMGGRNRACTQANLNSSWVTSALNQGWNLIPTWVGYQSPSSICTGCAAFSTSAATARTNGISEADLAANAAETLGLTKPNIIYYNLEKYNVETAAEPAFVDGWSAQIRARGYVPGMYVHWTNVASFASITNPPQSVWVARWSGSGGTGPTTAPNPDAITGVSNTIFVNNRIWQHYGDVNQTWGGVAIAIDMNVANGPVVGKDVTAQPQTITFGALSNRVINTAAFNLSATASSGLAVIFVSQTPTICTVTGTRATLLAVGTCTFRASQSGDSSYSAAANVDQSFSIAQQTQTITFAALPSRILSTVTFDLNAATSSGLLASYTSLTTSVCTVNGERLLTIALGTCTVRASQAGNSKVVAATSADQSFAVVAQSTCSLTVATNDCDMDGIPNGIEASVTRSSSTKDNDVFTVTKLFIMQAYRDFLKREATATEITNWTTEFNAGRQTRASMIESFLTSADFGVKHAPVARLYFAAFNRVPQWSGQQYWAGQLGTKTIAQIADAFVASSEFVTTYGTLDDTSFVNRAYQNTLGRAPTSTELTTALNELASATKTRGGVLAVLSESTTHQNATRNEINITMIYWGMLQRRADQSGFDYWLGQLDTAAKTTQGVISSFLSATEYRTRFMP
jgi:hypothetical protein